MAQRTFASHTIPITTHLTLGKVLPVGGDDDDMALHLVPLTHITQMRPTFTHVDVHMAAYANTGEDEALEHQKAQEQQESLYQNRKPIIYLVPLVKNGVFLEVVWWSYYLFSL